MYLGPVVAAQQVLDTSPQHTHLRTEESPSLPPRCILAEGLWAKFTTREEGRITTLLWYTLKHGLCQIQTSIFIALIHPIQWTIALPVGATGPAKRQKKYRQDRPGECIRQVAHRTSSSCLDIVTS